MGYNLLGYTPFKLQKNSGYIMISIENKVKFNEQFAYTMKHYFAENEA